MPLYQLDMKGFKKEQLQKHAESLEGAMIQNGKLVIVSRDELPRIKGVSAISEAEPGKVKPVAVGAATRPLVGLGNLELHRAWRRESYSTREANIVYLPVHAGSPGLTVVLGGGRGDQVCIGSSVSLPPQAKSIGLRAKADIAADEAMTLTVVLTSERERPWLELAAVTLQPGVWQDLNLALEGLDTKRLAKADRLVLMFTSDADEGYVQLQELQVM